MAAYSLSCETHVNRLKTGLWINRFSEMILKYREQDDFQDTLRYPITT